MKATKETIPPVQPTVRIVLEMTRDEADTLNVLLWYGKKQCLDRGNLKKAECLSLWEELKRDGISTD